MKRQHRNEQRRNLTINDEVWALANKKADEDDISVSLAVRLLLQAWAEGKIVIQAKPVTP